MPDYETLYFRLFAATVDAVEAMDDRDLIRAKEILMTAQLSAEDAYLSYVLREGT